MMEQPMGVKYGAASCILANSCVVSESSWSGLRYVLHAKTTNSNTGLGRSEDLHQSPTAWAPNSTATGAAATKLWLIYGQLTP